MRKEIAGQSILVP